MDELEFWNEYSWNWKTPQDVQEFVGLALENLPTYDYAYEGDWDGDENFYTNWWSPVEDAIYKMAVSFSQSDLEESIRYLLAPEGEFVECDPAIISGIIKHVPGFPEEFPELKPALDLLIDPDEVYSSDWWDFSWYPFISAYFTQTFWGPELLAKSIHVPSNILEIIFQTSFSAGNPYKAARVRIALAMNPRCPKHILDFLYENRNGTDWLLNDAEEEGVFIYSEDSVSIDESVDSLGDIREDAESALHFRYPTTDQWSSSPGAQYVENLFDISWEAESMQSCLLTALARNANLEPEQYEELANSEDPLVRIFLSVNPSISEELKAVFELNPPTLTFTPYDGHPDFVEEVTLQGDINSIAKEMGINGASFLRTMAYKG